MNKLHFKLSLEKCALCACMSLWEDKGRERENSEWYEKSMKKERERERERGTKQKEDECVLKNVYGDRDKRLELKSCVYREVAVLKTL